MLYATCESKRGAKTKLRKASKINTNPGNELPAAVSTPQKCVLIKEHEKKDERQPDVPQGINCRRLHIKSVLPLTGDGRLQVWPRKNCYKN